MAKNERDSAADRNQETEPEFDLESILQEFGAETDETPTAGVEDFEDTILWSRRVSGGTKLLDWQDMLRQETARQADDRSELKNKLMQGPEKRYYQLAELGISKLQVAIFLNLLVLVLSAGGVILYAAGMVRMERLRLLILGEIFSMTCSGILGCYQLAYGLRELAHGRITPEILMLFSLIACCADSVACLRQLRVPYCCLFCLQMTMALWAEYDRRRTELFQMDTLRKAEQVDGVVRVPDYYESQPGFLRGTGRIEDFMEHYQRRSGPEKALSVYVLLAIACCVGTAFIVGNRFRLELGLQVLAIGLLTGLPVTGFVANSHPHAILARRLHRVGSVLCGWEGIQELCGSGSVPLREEDLFPSGSVKMNGVKFFGSRDPGQMMAYAAALIEREGGGLAPLFRQLLDNRSAVRYSVKNLRSYTNGGIGGEINGEPVLMGTQRFLRDMGIEMPDGTRVHQAVYLAVDGTLCGVFAISYNRNKDVTAGLNALYSYRNIKPVLLTSDFMVTAGFLREKFGGNANRIICPTRSVREDLASRRPAAGASACALLTREHLNSMAYAITGARSVRNAVRMGVAEHILCGFLGLGIVLALVWWGNLSTLSTMNLLVYQIVLTVPGLLLTQWARGV